MSQQLLIIVGRQRSGTTVLAETLSNGPCVHSFGEAFHDLDHREKDGKKPDLRLRPEANFFLYRSQLFAKEPTLAYPSVENQTAIFDSFVNYLYSLTDKKWVLLDIKYNSWHHFEHIYSVPGQAPFLLHLLRTHNAAFAHIRRANSFARYCSEQLALSYGVWHSSVQLTDYEPSLIIEPAAALRDMVETQRQIDLFDHFLRSVPRRIELRYEEMLDGSRLSPSTDAKLTRLLDGDWTPGASLSLQKVAPPLAGVVRNRDEVLAYFNNTTFAKEVEEALAFPR